MSIDTNRARAQLRKFDFKNLFIEELGWSTTRVAIPRIEVDGLSYAFKPIAEQGGMIVAECTASDGNIPAAGPRATIDQHVEKFFHEHLIVFVDRDRTVSRWTWIKAEKGVGRREHGFDYRAEQPGDSLLQRLAGIAFAIDELDDDGKVSIATVTSRVAKAFDVERVTKKFYEQFQKEHDQFLAFLTGLQDVQSKAWYVSVMLNRMMFLYFIQKKGFLNGDRDYLPNQLSASQARGTDLFYRDFLYVLFFQGLASEKSDRSVEVNALLGEIPYLNGGIFLPHAIEEANPDLNIPDVAFERLFQFFDRFNWHLDDRPLRQDNEINPDVLGYIFEKYINQKQMGAYYTKEDITDYICKYTILPFLLDKIGLNVAQAMRDVDPYIYEAVKTTDTLPTETEREYSARRKRYDQIRADFAAGQIATVNDLITYNLNIREFVEDYLRGPEMTATPIMLRRFYTALTDLTVLDPTCGSGAFLFAAMNILAPLYNLCLDKMALVVAGPNGSQYPDFKAILDQVGQHPNRDYFVLKSVIVNNLYGVDIMEEAVEICKLRLFLKLVAQLNDPARIEPLPDIDFNIRAGNTLVGFATEAEIEADLFAYKMLPRIKTMSFALRDFRKQQLETGVAPNTLKILKRNVRSVQAGIAETLDTALMWQYGQKDLPTFRGSHKPFHWYAEFNSVMATGGFDVVVGNPPYAELRSITNYTFQNLKTVDTKNLYSLIMERCLPLSVRNGRVGLIVPVSSISTEGYRTLQNILFARPFHASSFDDRPSKLFEGLEHIQLTIYIIQNVVSSSSHYTTSCYRWSVDERDDLFARIQYQVTQNTYLPNCLPKISRDLENSILIKIWSNSLSIGTQVAPQGIYHVYYSRKVHNFLQALDFIPEVYNGRGELRPPSELKDLRFASKLHANIVFCVLNSSLFRWYINVFSDCRHVNKREVEGYRLNLGLTENRSAEIWNGLSSHLSAKLRETSEFRQMRFLHDTLRVQCIIPKRSKSIIDEIDRVLAQHYGFTDEELDFIINYDIKYRMGKDAESDEGEE